MVTEVEFRLDACGSETELFTLMEVDDVMELQLRRLAAKVNELRTGDRDAAMHMLGTALPGQRRDLVPGCLVSEATLHPKNQRLQTERVAQIGRSPAVDAILRPGIRPSQQVKMPLRRLPDKFRQQRGRVTADSGRLFKG